MQYILPTFLGVLCVVVSFFCGFMFCNTKRIKKIRKLIKSLNPKECNGYEELRVMEGQFKILKEMNYFI